MARLAVFSFPGSGHVNPVLPLLAELVRRGEDVVCYLTEEFRAGIEATGARFHPLPDAVAEFTRTLAPGDGLFRLANFQLDVISLILPLLDGWLDAQKPDYVLTDTMAPWGRLIAQKRRLPAMTFFPSFGSIPAALPPLAVMLLVMGGGLGRLPANVGLHRRHRALSKELAARFGVDQLQFKNAISNPSNCNLVFTSERFQIWREKLDARFHFVGPCLAARPPDPDFPLESLSKTGVVYISLGTVFNDRPDFFRQCLAAFGGAPYPVVISIGKRIDPASLGPAPSNCLVRAHVPQLEVLERASLFITHAGMNSVNEGLFNDVPLLVYPQAADQFLVSRRVIELGVGKKFGAADLQPGRLRPLAEQVMGDAELRKRVAEVGRSLREAGGVARAADTALEFRDANRAS